MDIPRIFTISESEHRIHNPFTEREVRHAGSRAAHEAGHPHIP